MTNYERNAIYSNLGREIVLQAVKDYTKALSGKIVEGSSPAQAIRSCENFFRSKHFSLFTNIPGETVIKELRKYHTKQLRRKV